MLMLLCAMTSLTWADSWVKTAPGSLTTGDIVAIVDLTSGTAMSNNNGTTKAPDAVAVDISDDQAKLTTAPDDNLMWSVSVSDGKFTFTVPGTDNYLYSTNANNGMRVGTGENGTYSISTYEETGADFLQNDGTARFVGVYNNQDWRCYTTVNNNIKGCVTAFYKKVNDGTVTKQSPGLTATDITLTEGETAAANITTKSDGSLTFSTSDASVATISTTGTISAKTPGTATITVKQAETANYIAAETTFEVKVLQYVAPGSYATVSVPYEVDFTKSQDLFVIEDIDNDLGTPIWTQSSSYGMTATTYLKLDGEEAKTNHDGESWLVSPLIDLTSVTTATLTFSDNWNAYFSDYTSDFGVFIHEEGGRWQRLDITYEKPEKSFNGWRDEVINLADFIGKKVQVGFYYCGSSTTAGTYEVRSFSVTAEAAVVKQEAGLTFEASTFTATIGESNTFPTLINPNNLTVAWSSSHEDVATVDATGAITLVAPGSTTIKVVSEETDNFLAGSASYQLVVKEKAIAGTDVYELVTDASTLAEGDQIILVNEENTYALSTTQATNNRSAADVALESNGTIIPSNLVQVITLEGEAGSWLLNVGEKGYLYAPSTTANQLKSETTPDEKASAAIAIDADAIATVQFNQWDEKARTLVRFNPNSGNPIFSCYATTSTTGTLLRVYRNTSSAPVKQAAGIEFSEETCTATIGEENTFPTLSNPNKLAVTYASDNEQVATVNASGAVTLVAAGTAKISASTAENEQFKAGYAFYTLTVVEKQVDNDIIYSLVTDAASLAAGDVIILVGENVIPGDPEQGTEDQVTYYGLGTNQKSNNREAVTVTHNNDGTFTGNNFLQEITLEEAESTWLFNVGTGYLFAASSKANQMKTEDEADDNAKATIAIAEDGATIIFQGENTRNHLRFNFNNGAPIFSAYAETSTMPLPKIYRKGKNAAGIRGDINGDGVVDVVDVMIAVDYVLKKNPANFNFKNAEVSGDGIVDVTDIMMIVDIILKKG